MPLYDFRCVVCTGTFELLAKSDTVPPCPACGADALTRLVAAPAAPPQSDAIKAAARRQATREGHLSHFTRPERRGR